MLGGSNNECGLGFNVIEDAEGGDGSWNAVVFPYEDACNSIKQPLTKEEFVKTAETLGIEWNIDEVMDLDDYLGF